MRFASREFASRKSQVKIIYTDSGWSLEMSVCYLRAPYRRSSLRPSNHMWQCIVTLQCQLWLPLEVQSSRCCFENNLTVRFSLRSHFAGHREHRRSYLRSSTKLAWWYLQSPKWQCALLTIVDSSGSCVECLPTLWSLGIAEFCIRMPWKIN